MDCEQRHEVQQWLLKSQRDLEAARRLFSGEDPLLDIVVYHCQQSAEKALKAYLCYCDAIINFLLLSIGLGIDKKNGTPNLLSLIS